MLSWPKGWTKWIQCTLAVIFPAWDEFIEMWESILGQGVFDKFLQETIRKLVYEGIWTYRNIIYEQGSQARFPVYDMRGTYPTWEGGYEVTKWDFWPAGTW